MIWFLTKWRLGKIEAVKKERNWYSNMKAIKRYLEGVR